MSNLRDQNKVQYRYPFPCPFIIVAFVVALKNFTLRDDMDDEKFLKHKMLK